ncbi:MAG: hypothetical protein ABI898_00375 [Sphingomonadales bacterium]
MWPFTSRRIFGNRWWAIGFVVFVCWQAIDFTNSDQAATGNSAVANAEYAHAMENSLNSM